MKPDFEKRLQRQAIRPIPNGWREDILRTATPVMSRESTIDARSSSGWRELLWPCPRAWGALAAVWVMVVAVNISTTEPAVMAKNNSIRQSHESRTALLEQRRELIQLFDSFSPTLAQPAPRPRSERRREAAMG